MLAIKLSRIGKKKQPSYRLIVVEKHKDPKGDYLEKVGFYNPRTEPNTIKLDAERIKHWISKGAQPTDTVHNLLIDAKIIEGEKTRATSISKKRLAKKESASTVIDSETQTKRADKEKAEEKTKPEEPKESVSDDSSADKIETTTSEKKPEFEEETKTEIETPNENKPEEKDDKSKPEEPNEEKSKGEGKEKSTDSTDEKKD